MQQTVVHGRADPQTTIAIPKQTTGFELQSGRKRIRLGFPVLQPGDPTVLGDQQSAVLIFNERIDSKRRIRDELELRRPRLPFPQAGRRSRPEIARAILI